MQFTGFLSIILYFPTTLFNTRELLARIRAVLRRRSAGEGSPTVD
ncbi:hypothetical protein LBWT_X2550 (plasmid) [Leptolyngbya boryana IAM M-101]|nr:hypothetical protein LBWT_X2550 [Leptolyngbya boryana IAM M-101]BAS66531.1 hypothetical protein LBDG_X2550 [Leptolyngbya boryana dg5]